MNQTETNATNQTYGNMTDFDDMNQTTDQNDTSMNETEENDTWYNDTQINQTVYNMTNQTVNTTN